MPDALDPKPKSSDIPIDPIRGSPPERGSKPGRKTIHASPAAQAARYRVRKAARDAAAMTLLDGGEARRD